MTCVLQLQHGYYRSTQHAPGRLDLPANRLASTCASADGAAITKAHSTNVCKPTLAAAGHSMLQFSQHTHTHTHNVWREVLARAATSAEGSHSQLLARVLARSSAGQCSKPAWCAKSAVAQHHRGSIRKPSTHRAAGNPFNALCCCDAEHAATHLLTRLSDSNSDSDSDSELPRGAHSMVVVAWLAVRLLHTLKLLAVGA